MKEGGKTILEALDEHIGVMELVKGLSESITDAASAAVGTFKEGGKIVLFGNGGSSCDAQHVAAEMLGVTEDRDSKRGLLAIALTDNTALLTAIGNDLGYEDVFSRQIEALVQDRDLVIGFSTSGNSPNGVKGIAAARDLGAKTIALTGGGGGRMAEMSDIAIRVPSDSVPRIQEAHITIGHIICEMAQRSMRQEYMTRFTA
jgi:D-sedoheptulose 7-phosphate isomerase